MRAQETNPDPVSRVSAGLDLHFSTDPMKRPNPTAVSSLAHYSDFKAQRETLLTPPTGRVSCGCGGTGIRTRSQRVITDGQHRLHTSAATRHRSDVRQIIKKINTQTQPADKNLGKHTNQHLKAGSQCVVCSGGGGHTSDPHVVLFLPHRVIVAEPAGLKTPHRSDPCQDSFNFQTSRMKPTRKDEQAACS